MRNSAATTMAIIGSLFLFGCTPPESTTKKDDTGIFGKTTQQVGEFDPNANNKVSDSTIDEGKLAVPLIGAASAYGPLVEKVAKLGVQQRMNYFYAEHGRFPKDHEEFMQRIVVDGELKLPVLPGGATYQYDVENHELVIIQGDGKAVIPDN